MKLSLKTLAPLAAAGLLVSCNSVTERTKEYMKKRNYTQQAFNNIKSADECVVLQSKLDSMAYRNIFNSTQAAKDSAKIAEFEKIAASMRPDEMYPPYHAVSSIDDKLSEQGISIRELDEIKAKDSQLDSDVERANMKQHLADDWAYRKFFKKIGILNDSVSKLCDDVSKEIRP